ncbi:MAG: bifunctional (p)ppGpp synthetase/guanosine-3',5'-bis(diphosphate) 3'-pyrophosphohydrolase [Clostridiales Family XIII bacterium]|jgi:GTP pyrophosphokinase|nr:bifunctional (p)ppGpp synthetase/guanosine-3',5'-bis(diphosphate) 3'-pyrophosphohydrolase [Clostridiales Family XIII bacterium]
MDRLEQFLSDLLDFNPNIDIGLIENAYKKADQMHAGQLRKSLEPYIIHPIEVAKILADLGMDDMTIAAGLLHDAVEDTPYSIEELQKDFGAQVAFLVNGVTKLGNLVYENKEERQAENLRKMFLAISKDIRVLIIKLADRLHNLRTINYMSREQIVDKCRETLEIYAPLASRLGIYTIKFELEDIALKYLDPEAYYMLVGAVQERKSERDEHIGKVIGEIKAAIDEYKIEYEITGRAKHFYSIYTKMKEQGKPIDEIFDLTAVRIIVDTVRDCYAVLGTVHTLWRPMPGRFKDYIAMPKPNMYQSLHTTLIDGGGSPFEVQIRTKAMHRVAEYGIAAHWKYKEGATEDQEELKLAWIRQTLEWNREMNDPREYMETMRTDLFSDQVFVFTPRGDVIELPAGSTPLDFAFKIHSDIGIKCAGARVNSKMVPIDYALQNGEVIEIITSNSTKGPSMDWLSIAKSAGARSKIRQWLKKQDKSQNIERGRTILEKAVKRKGYDVEDVVRAHWLARIAKQQNFAAVNELYTALSYGGAIVSKVIAKLVDMYQEEYDKKALPELPENLPAPPKPKRARSEKGSETLVLAGGLEGMLIRLSKCCSPVPGDEIAGFVTKGRGVSVHRADCPNITSLPESERARLIAVEWDTSKEYGTYNADIYILANDRKGLFSDISRACVEMNVNISGVNLKTNSDNTVSIAMTLSISNVGEMKKILRTLRQIESVIEVYRSRG